MGHVVDGGLGSADTERELRAEGMSILPDLEVESTSFALAL